MNPTSCGSVSDQETLQDLFRIHYSELHDGIRSDVGSLVNQLYSIGLIAVDTRDSSDSWNGVLKTLEAALKTGKPEDAGQRMADFLAVLATSPATEDLAKKIREETSQRGVLLPPARKVSSVSCTDVSYNSAPPDLDEYAVSAHPTRRDNTLSRFVPNMSAMSVPSPLTVGSMYNTLTANSLPVDLYNALLAQLQIGTVERAACHVHNESSTQMKPLPFTTNPEKRQQPCATEEHPEELDTPSIRHQENRASQPETPPSTESDTSHSHAQTNGKSRPSSAPAKPPHEENCRSYQETSQGSSESFVMATTRTPTLEPSTLTLSSPSTSPNRQGVSQSNSKEGQMVTEEKQTTHSSAREPCNCQSVSLEKYQCVLDMLQRRTQEAEKLGVELAKAKDELAKAKDKLDQKERECTRVRQVLQRRRELMEESEEDFITGIHSTQH